MTTEEKIHISVDSKVSYLVPKRWEFIRKVGSGAYGTVASFKNIQTGEKVAVKKVQNAFDDLVDAKRILREIKILRQLNNDNIIRILELFTPESPEFEDIYIVTDLMETDLHRVIYSKQVLTNEHYQYFIYQILRGLKYLHSADIIHRDLKPSNILVNKNCDLKICDFGLARGFSTTVDGESAESNLTDYVVTRWYRAPEVVLLASEYTKAIDIWSVGCILCELLGRKAIFTGKDHLDQIKRIIEVLGTPSQTDLNWLPPEGPARRFIQKCQLSCGKPLASIYPKAEPSSIDLAQKMLTFHPKRRISVEESLDHKYCEGLHTITDEPSRLEPIDWKFDNFKPTKRILQNMVYSEVASFHPEILIRDKDLIPNFNGLTKELECNDALQLASASPQIK